MTRPAVRLLHTSDLHVGEGGRAAGEDPRSLRSLRAVVDAANDLGVDAVVVAGDLFDNNRLREPVLRAASALFEQLAVPAVILPGNHDPLEHDSVFWRAGLPGHVSVLGLAGRCIDLPALRLSLWGNPHVSYVHDLRPLAGPPARREGHWLVAVAHGHVVRAEEDEPGRYYRITAADIAACRSDYVALGHWDRCADVSSGDVTASYCGSPNRVGVSALVTLEDGSAGPDVRVRALSLDP